MLISWQHRFLFVHIYKNAGTSIKDALTPYAASAARRKVNGALRRMGVRSMRDHRPYGHVTAAFLRDRLGSDYDDFTSFAVVRNPFSWQVSLYEFALRSPGHHQHALTRSFGDFDTYIRWRVDTDAHSQASFVCDDAGRQIVSRILRFETLSADFAGLCADLGIEASLGHKNQSRHDPMRYRSYYTARTRALIEDTFAHDLDLFGYEF